MYCFLKSAIAQRSSGRPMGRGLGVWGAACLGTSRSFHTCLVQLQAWALVTYRPWMCPTPTCRHVNLPRLSNCDLCGTAKPSTMRAWSCKNCDTFNLNGVKQCRGCGEPAASTVKNFWTCAVCHKNNAIDELLESEEESSICSFCQYNMAPKYRTEGDAAREAGDMQQRLREQEAQTNGFGEDLAALASGNASSGGISGWDIEGGSAQDSTADAASDWGGATAGDSAWGVTPPSPPPGPSVGGEWGVPTREYEQSGTSSSTQTPLDVPTEEPKRRSPTVDFLFKPFVASHTRVITQTVRSHTKSRPATLAPTTPSGPPGFQWMCRAPTCGNLNDGSSDLCSSCETRIQPTDWECDTCGAHNHWSRGICFNCTTAIAPSWLCLRCRTRTSIYETRCRTCTALRPHVDPVDPVQLRTRGGRGTGGRGRARDVGQIDWICQGCRAQNYAWRSRCFTCDMSRVDAPVSATEAVGWGNVPDAVDGQSHGGDSGFSNIPVNDSNWICTSCHASNFRTRSECWQCGRAAVGAAACMAMEARDDSSGSVPHFEKEGFQKEADTADSGFVSLAWSSSGNEDWICGRCYAKNFRQKQECYRCSAPRSMAAVKKKLIVKKPQKI